MIWRLEILVKYLAAFSIFWGLLWINANYSCSQVHGTQMSPTLLQDEYRVLDKGNRSMTRLRRGNIVLYEWQIPNEKQTLFPARLIAKEGERLKIVRGEVFLSPPKANDWELLGEGSYVKSENRSYEYLEEMTVPRDCVFVMCDNRKFDTGKDSRTLGPIPINAILGTLRQ